MKYKTFNQSGFSLVETLVAITILLLVIVGPMTISVTTAKSTSYASEQVVAFFLAQEGAELVQKVRDDVLLDKFNNPDVYVGDPWKKVMNTTNTTAGSLSKCFIDINPNGCALDFNVIGNLGNVAIFKDCTLKSNCDLYYQPSVIAGEISGRYRYSHTYNNLLGYGKQPYSRFIKLTVVNDNEVKVESTVYWRTGSIRQEQKVTAETYLFNIYENI